MNKLNIGCGDHPLPGWHNVDIVGPRFHPDTEFMDASKPFPFDDWFFDRIFTEHMIEHLNHEGAITCIAESFRVLRPGGRIRVSMPNLLSMINLVINPSEPRHWSYIVWACLEFRLPQASPASGAVTVFNNFMRAWGHQYLWTPDSFCHALAMIGFKNCSICAVCRSDDPEFRDLENTTRFANPTFLQLETMTIEAEKPV